MGMATVFAFLGILVLAIGATGRIVAPYERAEAPDPPAIDTPRDEELAVAIAVAAAFQRTRQGRG